MNRLSDQVLTQELFQGNIKQIHSAMVPGFLRTGFQGANSLLLFSQIPLPDAASYANGSAPAERPLYSVDCIQEGQSD